MSTAHHLAHSMGTYTRGMHTISSLLVTLSVSICSHFTPCTLLFTLYTIGMLPLQSMHITFYTLHYRHAPISIHAHYFLHFSRSVCSRFYPCTLIFTLFAVGMLPFLSMHTSTCLAVQSTLFTISMLPFHSMHTLTRLAVQSTLFTISMLTFHSMHTSACLAYILHFSI